MKIKIFTTETPGVISLTPSELQELLNEAYAEGYYDRSKEFGCGQGVIYTTTTTNALDNEYDSISANISSGSILLNSEDTSIKTTPYTLKYDTQSNSEGVTITTLGGNIKNEI